MTTLSFYNRRWLLDGHCVLFPTRRLRALVRGAGGTLYRDIERCSDDLDGIIVGGDMNDPVLTKRKRYADVPRVTELDIALELGLLGGPDDKLSALRGALHQSDRPRIERWWSAVAVLEAWPVGQDIGRGIDYLIDSTRGWPGEVELPAPSHWVKRALSGPEPRLASVDRLDLFVGRARTRNSADVAHVPPAAVPRVLAQTQRLRHLVLQGWYGDEHHFTAAHMRALVEAVARARVAHLRFSIPLGRDAIDALAAASVPGLERLTLRLAFQRHWKAVYTIRDRNPGVVIDMV
jgi:hypothetical protein